VRELVPATAGDPRERLRRIALALLATAALSTIAYGAATRAARSPEPRGEVRDP